MENVFKYYDFSQFITDESDTFLNGLISYTEINPTHFLIFEKNSENFNLYITKYTSKKDIGNKPPEILQEIVKDYDKSNPKHRSFLKKYLY